MDEVVFNKKIKMPASILIQGNLTKYEVEAIAG